MQIYLDAENYYIPKLCLEVPATRVEVESVPTGDITTLRSYRYEDGRLIFNKHRYEELGGV